MKESGIYYFLLNKEHKKNRKQRKYMSKIKQLDVFVRNEIINVEKIKEINNYSIYYNVYEIYEKTSIMEIDNEVIKGKTIKNNSELLFKYENKEYIKLETYLKTLLHNNGSHDDEFQKPPKYSLYLSKLIHFYTHLLQSIQILYDASMIHNNINIDTILVSKYSMPLLSDFSFSIDVSRDFQLFSFLFMEYNPSYIEWPFEFHLLSYFLSNKLNSFSSSNIYDVVQDVISQHPFLHFFGDKIINSFKNEAIQYFSKYVNQNYNFIIDDILQFSNTWDNYSLSIMFLRILINIHYQIHKNNKFIIFFMKLLISNTHFVPSKRLSIHSTLSQFNMLLNNTDTSIFLDIIMSLMSATMTTTTASSPTTFMSSTTSRFASSGSSTFATFK